MLSSFFLFFLYILWVLTGASCYSVQSMEYWQGTYSCSLLWRWLVHCSGLLTWGLDSLPCRSVFRSVDLVAYPWKGKIRWAWWWFDKADNGPASLLTNYCNLNHTGRKLNLFNPSSLLACPRSILEGLRPCLHLFLQHGTYNCHDSWIMTQGFFQWNTSSILVTWSLGLVTREGLDVEERTSKVVTAQFHFSC